MNQEGQKLLRTISAYHRYICCCSCRGNKCAKLRQISQPGKGTVHAPLSSFPQPPLWAPLTLPGSEGAGVTCPLIPIVYKSADATAQYQSCVKSMTVELAGRNRNLQGSRPSRFKSTLFNGLYIYL